MTNRIYVPQDTSARSVGAERLVQAWAKEPRLEILRTSSRGAFYLEPLVEVDGPRGRIGWPNANVRDLPQILRGEGGTLINDIPFLARQTRVTFANFGETRPLSLEDYQSHGGFKGRDAAQQLTPQEIIDEIKMSELRGRGGAAFPVWRKW
jgi:formate dehydrogenase iron-sulfur subunit